MGRVDIESDPIAHACSTLSVAITVEWNKPAGAKKARKAVLRT